MWIIWTTTSPSSSISSIRKFLSLSIRLMPVKSMIELLLFFCDIFKRIVKHMDRVCLSMILSRISRFIIPFSSIFEYNSNCCFSSTRMYIFITVKIANNSRWVKFGPYYELIWKTNPFSKKYVVIVPSTVRIFLLFLIFDDSNFRRSSNAIRILVAVSTEILIYSSGLKLDKLYNIICRVFSGMEFLSKMGSLKMLQRVWPRTSSKIR